MAVTFLRELVNITGEPKADLIAPGHPLLDAVVQLTIDHNRETLKHGAVLIDEDDLGETPRLLIVMTQSIVDGHDPARTISKRFDFVEITPDGATAGAGQAPYLDYVPSSTKLRSLLAESPAQPWAHRDLEEEALTWAVSNSLPEHQRDVAGHVIPAVERTRQQVKKRLGAEINFWDARHTELLDLESAGKSLKIKPETAYRRARDLERRLQERTADLDLDERLMAKAPAVVGVALVIPKGLIERLNGERTEPAATYAKNTAEVDARAITAVMAAERSLGRTPEEMAHNNPGFDIRSIASDGTVFRIEVKGRIEGSDDFQITRTEVLTAKNYGDKYRLAIVKVSPHGPFHDELRYLTRPFDLTGTDDFKITRFTVNWKASWEAGGGPL